VLGGTRTVLGGTCKVLGGTRRVLGNTRSTLRAKRLSTVSEAAARSAKPQHGRRSRSPVSEAV
jgi:hypothetical protein